MQRFEGWFTEKLGTLFSDEDYFDINVIGNSLDSMEITNEQTQMASESPYQKQIITVNSVNREKMFNFPSCGSFSLNRSFLYSKKMITYFAERAQAFISCGDGMFSETYMHYVFYT